MKNIATALGMYATDHEGHYPANLSQLTPNYLKAIHGCPSAMSDTYSASFQVERRPDAYTFFCTGNFHTATGILRPNFPQFSSYKGLILP